MAGLGERMEQGLDPLYTLSVGGRPDRRNGRGSVGCPPFMGSGYYPAIPPVCPTSPFGSLPGGRRRRRAPG